MKDNNQLLPIGISVMILIITILATYMIVDVKTKSIANEVVSQNLNIEYEKVGGKENYDKINEIQKTQIVEGLKQYDAQGGGENNPQANAPTPPSEGGAISLEQVKKVTSENTHILGNPDAEITWVEYSDIECPYCKKLHQSGTIEEIMKEYDGKVNFIFKQFPLAFHKQAQMEAEAVLCAGELGGKDKYYDFITQAFNGSKGNGESYTKESISKLGGELGIDEKKLLSCIESGKFKQQAQDEMEEGSTLFGITGTPGNVLINNKTGKWDKLPGAYPTGSFKQKIDSLLEK
ncbi:MAG: thioredoxin domain-containing protein [Candidatus Gracilibacteria bacterium]|nr:thioredoxin domain-containing protein [Candidatus Gracilibacteria bacterium]